MRSAYSHIVVVLLLCTALTAEAQQPRTRAEIEALINPSLSAVAAGTIAAEPDTHNLGDIGDEQMVDVEFCLTNTTAETITISELRTSCSCLRVVSEPTTIEAGATTTIEALFNPAGRSGAFTMPIFVYTTLDEAHPTARLAIEGRVVASDRWRHLPVHMGTARLSRKEVTIDGIKAGATRREYIAVANSGSEAITLSAKPTIEGLSFIATPTTLQPGQEGEIVISYRADVLPAIDIATIVVVDGIAARPTERMIKITIKR